MFARRDGGRSERYLPTRITLGFFGAGVWVAGVVAENRVISGTAIAILLVAVALGWLARYQDGREGEFLDEDGEDNGTDDREVSSFPR